MKKILFTIFVVITTNNISAQYIPIDTVMLNTAYRNLMVSNSREKSRSIF